MKNRSLLTVLACSAFVMLGACTTTGPSPADPMVKRNSIDAHVDASLKKLYMQVPGSQDLVARAKGVLVFPDVVSAGFIVGGSYGEGALRADMHDRGYYSTAAASVGLLAGADSKAVFVLFMTQQALDAFVASKGWTAGADASVTLVNIGANGSVDTQTAQHAILGFVLNNAGLMANLSIDGTKFTRLSV